MRNTVRSSHISPRLSLIAVLFTALLFSGGCGYTVASLSESDFVAGKMPEGINTLAIPFFDNRSGRPGVDSVITLDLADEFSSSVELTERDEADAVLIGVVKDYHLQGVTYTSDDIVRERRLTVRVAAVLMRRSDGEVLWSEESLSYSADFIIDLDNPTATVDAEYTALRIISSNLSRLIKERIFEGNL